MVADVLHRGYLDGRAGERQGVGYTFAHGQKITVASCGYADDVLVFAESAEALLRMHEWTRAFFGAHAFKLNTKKTKLMATGQRRKLRGKFLGVDGRIPIAAMDSKADFR